VVLLAVTENGCALEFASATLRDDKALVLAAVQQDSSALQHASATLQDDPDVLDAARNSMQVIR
jgi:hypothetical protein